MRFIIALGAIALLASMAFVFGGGRELSVEARSTPWPDFAVLVQPQTDPCTYQTLDTGEEREGTRIGIAPGTSTHAKFSEINACAAAPPCQTPSCFLQGEYFFRLEVESLEGGCLSWMMVGTRRGAWYGRVGDEVTYPVYSDPADMAFEKICRVKPGDVVEVVWMACPDIAGPGGLDGKVDLMNDLFGAMLAFASAEGDPLWNILADVNEDGVVDLMNDIFFVLARYGLDCSRFPLAPPA